MHKVHDIQTIESLGFDQLTDQEKEQFAEYDGSMAEYFRYNGETFCTDWIESPDWIGFLADEWLGAIEVDYCHYVVFRLADESRNDSNLIVGDVNFYER